MEIIKSRQAALLTLAFGVGVAIGMLSTLHALVAVSAFIAMSILAAALLSMMEFNFKYWMYTGAPTIGFIVGYFTTIGNS